MTTHRILSQTMDDRDMFDWLAALMTTNTNFMSNLSNSSKLTPLRDWLISKTSYLFPTGSRTTLGNRIFYLVNGISSLPKCRTCGKQLDVAFTAYSDISEHSSRFCCSSCAVSDPDVRKKIEDTSFARHGFRYSFSVPEVHEKSRQTCVRRYGCLYPMQNKTIADKVAATNLARYGSTSPFGNADVQAKAKATCAQKYGAPNPMACASVQAKARDALRQRYGVDNPMKSAEIRTKIETTMLNRYGSTSYLGTPNCLEDLKRWSRETYGVDHHTKSHEMRVKIEETNLQRYGNRFGKAFGTRDFRDAMLSTYSVEHPMQSHEIAAKARKRYRYAGCSFDSAPEIAFYIWLSDQGADFEYQPNKWYEYEHGGATHRYFPDFRVGDMYYEIKGDHFFNDSGTMVCPYRDKSWSDQQYAEVCQRYEAKMRCMEANDVVVLKSSDYAEYVSYVEQTRGKRFIAELKQQN